MYHSGWLDGVWCITQGGEMECGVSLRVVRWMCGVSLRVVRWSVVYHSGW